MVGRRGIVLIDYNKRQSTNLIIYSLMVYFPRKLSGLQVFASLVSLAAILTVTVVRTDAQTISPSHVKISILKTSQVRVHASLNTASQDWSFLNAYAGAFNLADRIVDFQAFGAANEKLTVKKAAPGEYRASSLAKEIDFLIQLPQPGEADVAHVTWLANDSGLLMLADLLPRSLQRDPLLVEFELPSGWVVQWSGEPDSNKAFLLENAEKEIFFVGSDARKASKRIGETYFAVIAKRNGKLPEAKINENAARVLQKYVDLTGHQLINKPLIILTPFPFATRAKWKAETRGSTVVVVFNPQAQVENWSGQLGVIFTHELLHLWVPNSLALQGDYDWFFEGFTLYQALLTALDLKLIDFKEYLATIARVYDSYLSYSPNLSLIEASERRWTTTFPVVYDKGMLVAFLFDLAIRRESQGRERVSDVYRQLFHRSVAESAEANEVIIRLLTASPAMHSFSRSFIESRDTIKLETILPDYGIRLETNSSTSTLKVMSNLTSGQDRLLRSLGYRH